MATDDEVRAFTNVRDKLAETQADLRARIAGAERAEAAEADLRARLAEYEHAITWNVTCFRCANQLDAAYAETVRREMAEDAVERVRALHAPVPCNWHSEYEQAARTEHEHCAVCGSRSPYPCPTIAALDGPTDTEGARPWLSTSS